MTAERNRATSDALENELQTLRALEAEARATDPSTARYRAISTEIESVSRRIFELGDQARDSAPDHS
jgi:hypothetical protein